MCAIQWDGAISKIPQDFELPVGGGEALERSVIGFKSRKPARNAVTVGWAVFSQDTAHEREGFLVGRIR